MRVRQIIFGILEYDTNESLEVLNDDLTEKLRSNMDNLEGVVQKVDNHTSSTTSVKQILREFGK